MINNEQYILNGKGYGPIAARLVKNGGDPACLQPFIGKNGDSYITVNHNGVRRAVRTNNTALLTRDAWLTLEDTVVQMSMPVLRAVGDLRARGLEYNLDGFSNPIIGYQTVGRITGAKMSMSGLREAEKDRPEYDIAFLPLPIIHKDCSFDARQVSAAHAHGNQFDSLSLSMAVQEVAIYAEKLLIGTAGSFSYGGYPIYGYTNHPSRITKAMTLPTAPGWTPTTFIDEILDMKQTLRDNLKPGPYQLYLSPNWEKTFDSDYSQTYRYGTLRERVSIIDRISGIESLDYLSGYQALLVSMDPMTIREVIGMDIKTVQWESPDGMEMFWKVMAIMVPQFRFDQGGRVGFAHGVA